MKLRSRDSREFRPSKREKQSQNDETTERKVFLHTLSFNKWTIIMACANRPFPACLTCKSPRLLKSRIWSFFYFWMTCSNITLSILQLPSRIFNIFVYFFIMGFRQPNLLHLSTALLALSLVGLNAQLIPQAHLVSPCSSECLFPHSYYRLYCRLSPIADCRNEHVACRAGLRWLSRPLPGYIFMGLRWRGTWRQNHAGSRE